MTSYMFRKFLSKFMLAMMTGGGILLFLPLAFIFAYLLVNGIGSLSLNFFFELPKPLGEAGGGMLHALLGTTYLLFLCSCIALPWGILGGVYLSETRGNKATKVIRFTCDLLNGAPSIIIGIFVYAILVKPLQQFSAFAGGVALAVVILPIVVRTTEEILKLVPDSVRQAGLGLGMPRWKVSLFIVLWGSRQNLLTGILIALARASGETAPLLFTAFGSAYLSFNLFEPMASLPVEIYNYSISPYEEWHNLAWTGALVLILFVVSLNLLAKFLLWRSKK